MAAGRRGMEASAADGLSRSTLVIVLAAAWLSGVNLRVPMLALGPLLPLITPSLHLSPAVAGALSSLPLLAIALVSLPGGVLVDRFGPVKVLLFTALGIAVVGGLRGVANNALVLLLCQCGIGVGVGIGQPALSAVTKSLGARWATGGTAVYTNGFILSGLFASTGSVLALRWFGVLSWRGVFFLWALLGILSAVGWMPIRLPSMRAAVAVPVKEAFQVVRRTPGLFAFAACFAGQSIIFYSLFAWLPSYYVSRGWSLAAASVPLGAISVGSIVGGGIAPWLFKWWGGFRTPLMVAASVTLLAQLGFWWLPNLGVPWSALSGLATSVALTLGMAAPAALASQEQVGMTAGVLFSVAYVGAALGPLGMGVLRNWTHSYTPALIYLVMVSLGFIVAAASVPKVGQPRAAAGAGMQESS